ncbi:DUF4395 domain-containing protein [Mucilaginibacter gilvus]|uniref:DUF4395 domain-containing protein n=1 Tax=Mucilaginibacter gilvus TaxID=2305909 RepID=A0A3S3WD09_9SPHI|nr:DUF4395 domain-containing protein [Mucilaginibacter gilvus]RWY54028.1 DUF4395 domain-containing protein [Mucilaginibacter gilvus]
MKKVIQFGEDVEGYSIPVLNEREIRAAAGILFLVIFTSYLLIILTGDFALAKYAITLFFTDFLIRVFISPRYSPALIVGRLIVRNQTPEYVGARQKKIAWIIGVILSFIMLIFMVILNSFSPITGIVCLLCMIFLFFESAFGICLACKVYAIFFKEKVQYCPGEVCDVKARQPIQKTSKAQLLMVLVFIGYIFLVVRLFNGYYQQKPYDMFGLFGPKKTSKSKY